MSFIPMGRVGNIHVEALKCHDGIVRYWYRQTEEGTTAAELLRLGLAKPAKTKSGVWPAYTFAGTGRLGYDQKFDEIKRRDVRFWAAMQRVLHQNATLPDFSMPPASTISAPPRPRKRKCASVRNLIAIARRRDDDGRDEA